MNKKKSHHSLRVIFNIKEIIITLLKTLYEDIIKKYINLNENMRIKLNEKKSSNLYVGV